MSKTDLDTRATVWRHARNTEMNADSLLTPKSLLVQRHHISLPIRGLVFFGFLHDFFNVLNRARYNRQVLDTRGGHHDVVLQPHTAERLGVNRNTIHKKLLKHELLDPEDEDVHVSDEGIIEERKCV